MKYLEPHIWLENIVDLLNKYTKIHFALALTLLFSEQCFLDTQLKL